MGNSDTNISTFKIWLLASRPKTLLASVVPILVGSATAYSLNSFSILPALAALVCALLIQVGTNFVNDLYDFLKGSDRKDRKGPTRVLAAGLVTDKQMRTAIYLVFSVCFLIGLYLVYVGGWIILLIGIVSIFAGYAYTAGPYPLAYNGLGDIFVFIFFGVVATVGTFYVQTLYINEFIFFASIPVGLLITNILVVNNYRDVDEDKLSNKNTLAVKFGKNFAKQQYIISIMVSFLALVIMYLLSGNYFVLIPLLSIPLVIKLIDMIRTKTGDELNKTLELTAKFSAIFGILLSIGIIL